MTSAVQKFGRTSIRDAARMREVAERIAEAVKQGIQPVVAVSAIGDETDGLLELPQQVSEAQAGRELDMLVTAGERKAAALLCLALQGWAYPPTPSPGAQAWSTRWRCSRWPSATF